MKVCFDVNTLIYLYTNAPQQLEVLAAYDVALLRNHETCFPGSALADVHYVLHHCGLKGKGLREAMEALFEMFHVFNINEQDGCAALTSETKDYEDALIAHSAARNGIDVIITYNLRDFANSPVKALSPSEYTTLFKPSNVAYASLELTE